ncbi:YihY/virulence factor BrkB family protein [Subtercola boreus]|uniref:Uncharacterized protein n=1 Tax=Subtercola boreus TaxID=120213 RepID=A0A3E0WFH0_9MICO|nr:YihY/virulence factor BrkB family protein [Subtercola boreus]RFA22587.1 hypothetical protein B7R24_02925 [Subtercola boreus]RFA22943.1 hypothetical protein B7R23_02920 [Subtercola boreus]RFA28694.1 hypothetical protein B7R25_02935 [Subtercola boreus]
MTPTTTDAKPSDAVEDATDDAAHRSKEPQGGIAGLIAKIVASKPVRVFTNYGTNGGPLLASGMSYQAVFAIFAALAVVFSVFGIVFASNQALQDALIAQLNASVPGLIGENGAIKPDALTSAAPTLGWTGIVAAAGLIFTAIGFIGSMRSGIRLIFNVPGPTTNFALLKLKDLGTALVFVVVLLISMAMTVASTAAISFVYDVVGLDHASPFALVVGHIIGLVVVFFFDTLVLAGTYRLLSGVPIPPRQLLPGAALAAVVMGILKALGSTLLGGATSNPLLASFAVIIGILIWFNLICQVVLIFASWITVSLSDAGIDARQLTPEQKEAEALQTEADAHRHVLEAQHAQLSDELQDARGLRRGNLARQLKRIDRELAVEKSAPAIDPAVATPPRKP